MVLRDFRALVFLTTLAFAALAANATPTAAGAATAKNYPISKNVKGHENTEWSQGYAFHVRDKMSGLPRVFLAGDSICQSYRDGVLKCLSEIAREVGVRHGIAAYDDLFSLLDPLDRETEWHDDCHLNERGKGLMAEQVSKVVLAQIGNQTTN